MKRKGQPIIEVGHGYAEEIENSFVTGANAARQALTRITCRSVSAVLVFASVRYDLQETLSGIRSVVGDVPIIGTTTAGEICNGSHDKSVVVVALASPYLSVQSGVGHKVSKDWRRAVREIVEYPSLLPYFSPKDNGIWNEMAQGGESAFAIVFAPGNTRHTASRGHEIVEELKKLSAGRLPIFGGCAADDWAMEANYVLFGDIPCPDGLVVAVFRTSLKFGIGMAHGFKPGPTEAIVTRAHKHEILELNGRPADEVYAEMFGATLPSLQTNHLTLSVGKPLGMSDTHGQYSINAPSYFTPKRGVRLAQPIQTDTILTIMEPDKEEMLNAGREALLRATLRANITNPAVVFTCSCALRSRILKENSPEEIVRMKAAIPDVPVVGFYSFGEFGSTIYGVNRYNNEVVVVLLLGQELSYSAQVAMENRRLRSQLESNVAELSRVKETLEEARNNLDLKVRQRTADLAITNERLLTEITERKHAEDTLRENEDLFARAFKNNPAFLSIIHLDTNRVLEVNDAWTEIMGYSREETIGHMTTEMGIHDEETWNKIRAKVKVNGSVRNEEVVIHNRKREKRILLVSREVIEIDGEPYALSMGLDITARKQIERRLQQYIDNLEKMVEERILALRESRQMLRLIIDNLPVGIDYVDSNERYLFSNKTYQKWWNRSEEHITGLTVQELMGEQYNVARAYLKAAMSGQEVKTEVTIKFGDGVTRDISVNIIPHRGADGEVKGLVKLIADITDIKKAQRELQVSEAKFRSLFENSMDGLFFTVPDGRTFMANPTACRILGRTEEEICELGRDGIVDMTDVRLPAALEIRKRDFKVKCELNFLHKSGTPIPVEVTSTIFKHSHDEERAVVCFRDITERKIAEQALLQAKAELETKVFERTAELHETNEQLKRELMERKRLDRSLLESSQFLRQTEKIARIGGWKVNPLTDSVKWTEGVYNIIEAPLDYKPRMEDGLRFYTQPYRSILKEALLKALEHNEPFKLEAEVVTTSGKHLWTEVRGLIRVED
ncbi:MAG: PAS domain S-box protein, partial [Deltaproteobacteria bacterium]|nr:PAS domain S-box protein [Deltaproteobacteria bacterium]